MHKITIVSLLAVAALTTGNISFAQDEHKAPDTPKAVEPAPHFYHVVFLVQELGSDGKPNNGRSYTTTVSTDPRGPVDSIRTNARIPVVTSISKSASGEESSAQFQFMEIGVNFEVRQVQEVGRELSMQIKADVSGLFPSSDSRIQQPVVRHNQWDSPALIPIGKPTVIFTSDALDSKGSIQVVVTATPL